MKLFYSILVFLMFSIMPLIAQTHTVSMVDNEFIPADITVQEGDTVFWVNDGSNVHTSTSGENCTSDGNWNSGDIDAGQEFAFIFSSAGEYPYFCQPHCGLGMDGSVTVEATSSSSSLLAVEVSIFPNPVRDRLQIADADQGGQIVEYYLTDLKGNKVLANSANAIGKREMDLSSLSPGVYFLHLQMEGDNHLVKRVMKVN